MKGTMGGKAASLKAKLLKFKIIFMVIVCGFGLIVIGAAGVVLYTGFQSAIEEAIDTTTEAVDNFFESMGNFIIFGSFRTTANVFLDKIEETTIVHGIAPDRSFTASALTIESMNYQDYPDDLKEKFYKERLEKIFVQNSTFSGDLTYVQAIAYNQVGYYDQQCREYADNSVPECGANTYEPAYAEYSKYEVPMKGLPYEGQTAEMVLESTKKVTRDPKTKEILYTDYVKRTHFFSYQKAMYFLDKEYIRKMHSDLMNKSGQYDTELSRKLINDVFQRREAAVEKVFGSRNAFEDGIYLPANGYSSYRIPSDVVAANFVSPFGGKKCFNQGSCFKVYGSSAPGWYCKPHSGMDFPASSGVPLYAIASGTVSYVSRDNRNCLNTCNCPGIQVHIKINVDNGDGTSQTITVKYLHLSNLHRSISVGDELEKGDFLGNVGNTGCSDGNHLHLEMSDSGGAVMNPEYFIADVGCSVRSNCESIRRECGA